jgi:hypothetical protein
MVAAGDVTSTLLLERALIAEAKKGPAWLGRDLVHYRRAIAARQ